MISDYPDARSERRHGPSGYAAYESYRQWLRDEFQFRCVYCLKREVWGQITGEFEIDHFQPQVVSPERSVDYFNLVYCCRRCNAVKLDQSIDDPLSLLTPEYVVVLPDGLINSANIPTQCLILQLDLNAPRIIRWRIMWMRIVQLAAERDFGLHLQLTGFPEELPDLASLKPPLNYRPDGIEESWYAKRERGMLPESY